MDLHILIAIGVVAAACWVANWTAPHHSWRLYCKRYGVKEPILPIHEGKQQ